MRMVSDSTMGLPIRHDGCAGSVPPSRRDWLLSGGPQGNRDNGAAFRSRRRDETPAALLHGILAAVRR